MSDPITTVTSQLPTYCMSNKQEGDLELEVRFQAKEKKIVTKWKMLLAMVSVICTCIKLLQGQG